jgi:hypothetical protein
MGCANAEVSVRYGVVVPLSSLKNIKGMLCQILREKQREKQQKLWESLSTKDLFDEYFTYLSGDDHEELEGILSRATGDPDLCVNLDDHDNHNTPHLFIGYHLGGIGGHGTDKWSSDVHFSIHKQMGEWMEKAHKGHDQLVHDLGRILKDECCEPQIMLHLCVNDE